jgi:uncharacterized membrane protein SpoIIM required for sporulation
MISNAWLEQKQPAWTRLDLLIQQAERSGLRNLSAAELRELGLLYRHAATDLSAVRGVPAARVTEESLNRLVSRAHHYVYTGQKTSLRGMLHFFAREYPVLFRRLLPFTLGALLVFLAGGLLGTLLTLVRPEFMNVFLGPQMVATIEQHKMWTESVTSMKPQASAGIMTNNISVTFATFAGGIVAGVGTLWLLFNNGLMLGVIATACGQNHMALSLWSFVAAHGALELPAIFVAGGAGLRIGWALLFPGLLRRGEALAVGGAEAVRLLAGTIPMLIVAGSLEGFLSPSHVPVAIKFGVSAAMASLLWFWLGVDREP